MKKILITGGAGFVGYHLARHLSSQDDVQLTLVDNLFRGKMDKDFEDLLEKDNINFINLDLLDPKSYDKLGGGYDHVYHLAAVNGTDLFYKIPDQVLKINTLSLIYILDWFKEKNIDGKFCFTSSNEAYAGALKAFDQLPLPTPEDVPLVIEDTYNPRWTYAATKLVGELFVINYAKVNNFRAVIVRPHNFYGPRAGYSHVLPQWSQKIADKQDPFELFGKDETRTFCYIDDAVKAMSILMDSVKTDYQPIETVHIGNTDEITMNDLAKKMFKVTGWSPSKIEYKDSPAGSVRRRLGDISKIVEMTGWKPEVTLEEGLKKTYDWYLAHPNK